MKRVLFATLTSATLFASCASADLTGSAGSEPATMTRDQIDAVIYEHLETQGDFHWNDVDDRTLWSAVVLGDYHVSVGYREDAEASVKAVASAEDDAVARQATRNELLSFIAEERAQDGAAFKSAADLVLFEEDTLAVLDVEVDSYETLVELRQRDDVRYVEPLNYLMAEELQKSSAGCSNDADFNIPAEDFDVVSGNIVPWNFVEMNIPQAWQQSTGSGVTVALIDSGTSAAQAKLNGAFASGFSADRFIERVGTFRPGSSSTPDGPDDDCGHGTYMAGTIAAPMSGDGSMVGVAHGANLLAIRGIDDVIINSSDEKKGVADALILAAERSDVKVISMSLGHVFSSSRVADAVRYAHARGKLIFAAAGTSTSFTNWVGVTFPASMDETVAVTGIETGNGFVRCDVCHVGRAVEFVVVMQRASDGDRTSLSLTMSGNTPGRVGGSSTATATMAGVAALVWAKNPSLSRDQVLDILRASSSEFPSRDSKFGFGTVDAALAVSLAN
ncbi:S8 family peptidase [Haliangium ochraceum]|nr:S8 family serine peptidase [Haliangium ochraceum]